MSQSPYDRTSGFLAARYRRTPLAFCAVALAAAWTAWTLYEILTTPSLDAGWYERAREALATIGSGLIVAVGVVWLAEAFRSRP